MNLLQVIRGDSATDAEPADLQSVLLDLDRFGDVSLSRLRAYGWWCRIEVRTTALGAEFKVGSEMKHPTPLAAAFECRERLRAALATIAGGAA
jgi:hypothetical protein